MTVAGVSIPIATAAQFFNEWLVCALDKKEQLNYCMLTLKRGGGRKVKKVVQIARRWHLPTSADHSADQCEQNPALVVTTFHI